MIYLELLANSTSFNIILDECSYSGPPIMFFDGVEGFDFSRMSSGDFVVKLGGDFPSKFIVLGNIILFLKE